MNQLSEVDLSQNTSGQYGAFWQTDIPRLKAGHVGGQVCIYIMYINITLILYTDI